MRQQRGPVEAKELPGLGVTHSTLVWTEGMGDWLPASGVPEIAALLVTPAVPVAPVNQPAGAYVHQNLLVWSILATIFCVPIVGIITIVFSAQANSAYAAGRYAEAASNNRTAKTLLWISFGVGLAAIFVLIICFALGSFASIMNSY